MDFMWSLAVGGVLGLWFLATAIHQLRLRWWWWVMRFDLFHLLPRWTFFAPNPGRHDLHVVYREWSAGRAGPWLQVAPPRIDRRWRWLWNPTRYPRKAMNDLTSAVLEAVRASEGNTRVVLFSGGYVALLHWVMAQPPCAQAGSRRQFALVRTQGFGEGRDLNVQFVSEVHRAAP